MSIRIRKMDSRRIMFRRSRRIRKTDSRRNGSESRRRREKSQVTFINIKIQRQHYKLGPKRLTRL